MSYIALVDLFNYQEKSSDFYVELCGFRIDRCAPACWEPHVLSSHPKCLASFESMSDTLICVPEMATAAPAFSTLIKTDASGNPTSRIPPHRSRFSARRACVRFSRVTEVGLSLMLAFFFLPSFLLDIEAIRLSERRFSNLWAPPRGDREGKKVLMF
ncbi:hypothetical protein BC826DRAFT_428981 [Russula brevipes]|nr:hypothetical protein BC826DRAFT_428981 [Russula brevipes]